MAKKIKMNIEVRNLIIDLKRLGKTSGQISKTISELSPEMVCTTYSGCKERKQRAWKFTEGYRTVLNLWMSQNSDLSAREILQLFQKEMNIQGVPENMIHLKTLIKCSVLLFWYC